jgi:hypothetical protein
MGQAATRITIRKQAKTHLDTLFSRADQVILIHYSCESFYDRPDGSSPRITSIGVRNLASGQTSSFSIHQMAERKKYAKDILEQKYNELEKMMLDEFYKYIYAHSGSLWLHWNMRDINYGFQALAHRYKVLGGSPVEIHESQLFDLSRIFLALYGPKYIGHPRLHKLFEKNNLIHKDLLSGAEEAISFDKKEYVKLHQSTLRKLDNFETLAERANDGTLKTDAKWSYTLRDYPEAVGDFLRENWIVTILVFVITIVGFIYTFIQ